MMATYEERITRLLDRVDKPTTIDVLLEDGDEMVGLVVMPTARQFRSAEGWDESKHPRDDDGRFTEAGGLFTHRPGDEIDADYFEYRDDDPNQPRDPKGSSTGGRWTDGDPTDDIDIDDAHEAVTNYTEDSAIINHHLRQGLPVPKEHQKTLATLDAVVAAGNSRSYDHMTIYRGITKDFAGMFKVGAVFEDEGFVSTTASKAYSRQFIEDSFGEGEGVYLHIDMPGGMPVFSVNNALGDGHSYAYQSEIILPRNSRFKVLSKKGDTIKVRFLREGER